MQAEVSRQRSVLQVLPRFTSEPVHGDAVPCPAGAERSLWRPCRHSKGLLCEAHLLRRSHREDGKLRNETVATSRTCRNTSSRSSGPPRRPSKQACEPAGRMAQERRGDEEGPQPRRRLQWPDAAGPGALRPRAGDREARQGGWPLPVVARFCESDLRPSVAPNAEVGVFSQELIRTFSEAANVRTGHPLTSRESPASWSTCSSNLARRHRPNRVSCASSTIRPVVSAACGASPEGTYVHRTQRRAGNASAMDTTPSRTPSAALG